MVANAEASARLVKMIEQNADSFVEGMTKEDLLALLQSQVKAKTGFNVNVDTDFKEAMDAASEFLKPYGITKGMLVEMLMTPGLKKLGFPPGGE